MTLRKLVLVCLASVFTIMLLAVSSSAGEQERKIELIKEAVVRYVCFDEYWQSNMPYQRDKPVTMRLIVDGEEFYSKLENALSLYGTLVSMHQIGVVKGDRAVVTHNFEREMEKRFECGPVCDLVFSGTF